MRIDFKCSLLALGLWSTGLTGLAGALVFGDDELPVDTLPAELGYEVPFGLPESMAAKRADDELANLGRKLFFDPVLSADRSVSCASCHRPELGFADKVPFSKGVGGKRTLRNAPTLFNRALGSHFMWDGTADSLEQQVLLPISNPLEMGLELEEALQRLVADAGYSSAFEGVFGAAPNAENMGRALASFVRRLMVGDSRVDRFRTGERDALSRRERGGLWFFESRGGCWKCHVGANLSDEDFHNTGIASKLGVPEAGRQGITGLDADHGAFKTPTLRALALTAPYMHDGSLATLEEVVAFYRKGGHPNLGLDVQIMPIEMTDEDASNLAALLKAL